MDETVAFPAIAPDEAPSGGGAVGDSGAGGVRRGAPTAPGPDRAGAAGSTPARGAGGRKAGGARVARLPRAMLGKVAAVVVVIGVISYGLVQGGSTSAEPTVQAFLLAWQAKQYQAAAALTTAGGSPTGQVTVASELAGAYSQLDAAHLVLQMGPISQHGNRATAAFYASVNLGSSGLSWNYQGHFGLRQAGGGWKVAWTPSVIVPGLRTGDRLNVLTSVPSRAQIQGASGRSLARPSLVFVVGVRPGRLPHPRQTAEALSRLTPLDAGQVYGQIVAAPPRPFLGLLRLRPVAFSRLHRRLRHIRGLIIERRRERLFTSIAPAVSGTVGTETAAILRQDGVPYRPGATVGLSGLQAAYQRTLTGAPTTEVVLEDAAGREVKTLRRWAGSPGQAVKTTISGPVQLAADNALAGLPRSAAIVAVQAGTGKVLAVADHQAGRMPAVNPLGGQYRPGQVFTIVSTAALLQRSGFNVNNRVPCKAEASVGGVRLRNHPAETGLGASPLFATDFAHACGTAIAGLSMQLSSRELLAAARGFGIGAGWNLKVGSFAGTVGRPAGFGQMAAASVGDGGVRVSPLDMALAAGLVQSGTWRAPELVTSPADPTLAPRSSFSAQVVGSLRQLMRATVAHGAGTAASSDGAAVFGQVGNSELGDPSLGQADRNLRAAWFVGFQGRIAFAVIEFTRSGETSAAALTGTFLHDLRAQS
jgi:cell division protein FtsI/penicillin-binding protein 2